MPTLLDTLASYVPALVARRLAADPAAPTEPAVEQFPAAVLFADLSGFTPLTEKLAQSGPAGAEEITRLLNAYFGQLIDLITANGGEVTEFEGDALLAIWPAQAADQAGGEQAALAGAARRAAQCGLAVQAQLHNYPVTEGVQLSMRISIGAGPVTAMYIGGVFGRWKLLVTGAPLVQAGQAQRLAEPGQVILSTAAWQLAGGHLQGQPPAGEAEGVILEAVREPLPLNACPVTSLSSEADNGLRAYLPGAIIARLVPAQTHGGTQPLQPRPEWLAELRRVTILFINLLDLDETAPVEKAQAITRTVQTTLYHYEGTFNKIGISDKGTLLVAALGLPPLSHEDDAVRGVQAALATQKELRRLGVRTAIGITSGRIFCGSVGNDTRREYTMIGDSVNLAARLMQSAATQLQAEDQDAGQPGLVLCDQPTFESAQKRIQFEALEPIRVKGKTEPVEVFTPLVERSAPTTHTQMLRLKNQIIGRQAERMLLANELQALLRGGPGGVVVIEGQAGIGKSRLLDELRRQAAALRLTLFSLTGNAIEKAAPYQAWRPVFSQMLDMDVLSDPQARREHILGILEAGLEQDLHELAPLLNVVLPLGLPDSPVTAPMSGQSRADRTLALLLTLLQASTSSSPKVVIVEDAHWLDSASWGLTLAACRQVRPLLVVVALRPFTGARQGGETAPPEYQQILQLSDAHILRLSALNAEETMTLVRQRLGVAALPEPAAQLILERAEGNPFFAEELAYALRDAGVLTIVGGECQLALPAGISDLRSLRFPDTVQGVITGRVDRLHPQQQLVLKIASVIGREFTLPVLERIHPMEAELPKLRDHLSALEQLDMVSLESADPELTYLFKHPLIQDVAYNLMLFAQRRELHHKVGQAIETLWADRVSEFYGVLAMHFFRGEMWERAIDYSVKAGDGAVRLNAHSEALVHYGSALECLGHLPYNYANRRLYIDIALKQISLAWGTEPPDRHLSRLSEVEALGRALPAQDGTAGGGDQVRLAQIHLWMGRLSLYRNMRREAIHYFQQVLSELPQPQDKDLLAILYSAIARTLLLQGQFSQARPLLAQSVTHLSRRAEQSLEWLQAASALGVALVAGGQYRDGLVAVEHALARARDIHDRVSLAICYIDLCQVYLLGNQAQLALDAARLAVEAAERAGCLMYVYVGYAFQGWAEGHLGRHDAAHALMQRAYTLGYNLGGHLMFGDWFAAAQAEIELRANRAQEAARLAEQALAQPQFSDSLYSYGLNSRTLGLALTRLGLRQNSEKAEQHLADGLRCFESGGARLEAAHTHEMWGEALRQAGDLESAGQHFKAALAQYEHSDLRADAERIRRILAASAGLESPAAAPLMARR